MINPRLVREVVAQVIDEQSGHTFGDLPERYVVSIENYRKYPSTEDLVDAAALATCQAIKGADEYTVKSRFGEEFAAGVWCDDGTIYIDINTSFADLDNALAEAKERGEIAIYDQETGVCIEVG